MSDPLALLIGTALIEHFESLSLSPVPDTPPHWQIGYGMNYLLDGTPVSSATPPIDKATADAWLAQRLAVVAAEADADMPPDATAQQRGAIYSFSWNEGEGRFRGSTLGRLWRQGDLAGAAQQFQAWVYAGGVKEGGLETRRKIEESVFVGDPPDWVATLATQQV